MQERTFAYILVIISSVLFGLIFLCAKIALEELDVIQVLACRWTIAFIMFSLLILLKVIQVNYKGKPVKWIFLLIIIQPCTTTIFETIGVDLTTTSESAIIYAMTPIVVTLISAVVLRRKTTLLVYAGIVLSFAGVVVATVFGEDFSIGGKIIGYLFMLGGVLFASIYTILSGDISDKFTAIERTFAMSAAGCIWFNMINVARGKGFDCFVVCLREPEIGVVILFLGAVASFGGYMMFNYAISKIPPSQVSMLNVNLMTITGVVSGIIVQGDLFGWYTVIGLAMVVIGVIAANLKTDSAYKPKEKTGAI